MAKESYRKAIIKSIQNPNYLKKMAARCKEIVDLQKVEKAPVTKGIMELLL